MTADEGRPRTVPEEFPHTFDFAIIRSQDKSVRFDELNQDALNREIDFLAAEAHDYFAAIDRLVRLEGIYVTLFDLAKNSATPSFVSDELASVGDDLAEVRKAVTDLEKDYETQLRRLSVLRSVRDQHFAAH
jgi:hypothetical protein